MIKFPFIDFDTKDNKVVKQKIINIEEDKKNNEQQVEHMKTVQITVPQQKEVFLAADDIAKLKQKAYQQGKEDAVNQQQLEQLATDNQINSVLKNLSNGLEEIEQKMNIYYQNLTSEYANIAYSIIKKTIGNLNENLTTENIENFILDNIKLVIEEPAIAIHINPKNKQKIEQKITQNINFKGKIKFIADSNIVIGDCNIQWQDGCIKKEQKLLWQQLDKLIKQYFINKPVALHNRNANNNN